jgi:hypothetical protein
VHWPRARKESKTDCKRNVTLLVLTLTLRIQDNAIKNLILAFANKLSSAIAPIASLLAALHEFVTESHVASRFFENDAGGKYASLVNKKISDSAHETFDTIGKYLSKRRDILSNPKI